MGNQLEPGIFEFESLRPVIDPSAYVHPRATLIGDVCIGADVYVGAGAVLRGDWGSIRIEAGCNVQENCVIHMFPGVEVLLEQGSHVGHGATIHGSRLGKNVLVGIQAVVMDNVVVGDESIIGALSYVPEEMQIPKRSLVVGNPARIARQIDDDMFEWKKEGTALYQALPKACHQTLREVRPYQPGDERPEDRASQQHRRYLTWSEWKREKGKS